MKLEKITQVTALALRAGNLFSFQMMTPLKKKNKENKLYVQAPFYGYVKFGLSVNDPNREGMSIYIQNFNAKNSSYFINYNSTDLFPSAIPTLLTEQYMMNGTTILGLLGNLVTTGQTATISPDKIIFEIDDYSDNFNIGIEYIYYRPLATTSPTNSLVVSLNIYEYSQSKESPFDYVITKPKVIQEFFQTFLFSDVQENFNIDPIIRKLSKSSKWLVSLIRISTTEVAPSVAYSGLQNYYIIQGLGNCYNLLDDRTISLYPNGTLTSGTFAGTAVYYEPLPQGFFISPNFLVSANNTKACSLGRNTLNNILVDEIPDVLKCSAIEFRSMISQSRNYDFWSYATINSFSTEITLKFEEVPF